jgi:hypothetical protein
MTQRTSKVHRRGKKTEDRLELVTSRRAEMVALMRKGWTYAMIQEKWPTWTIKRIQQECYDALQELADVRQEDARLILERKLEELAEVKRRAWECYEKSLLPTKHVTEKEGTVLEDSAKIDKQTGKVKVVKRPRWKTVERVTTLSDPQPNSKFLSIVLECIKQERELLGLDRPRQVEVKASFSWDAIVKGVSGHVDATGQVPDTIEERLKQMRERGPHDPEVVAARINLQERIVLDHQQGIIPALPTSIPEPGR